MSVLGSLWVKNLSCYNIRVTVQDNAAHDWSHDYPPEHDGTIKNIFISVGVFFPTSMTLPVMVDDMRTNERLAYDTFEFKSGLFFQAVGWVVLGPEGQIFLMQGNPPVRKYKKLEQAFSDSIEWEIKNRKKNL